MGEGVLLPNTEARAAEAQANRRRFPLGTSTPVCVFFGSGTSPRDRLPFHDVAAVAILRRNHVPAVAILRRDLVPASRRPGFSGVPFRFLPAFPSIPASFRPASLNIRSLHNLQIIIILVLNSLHFIGYSTSFCLFFVFFLSEFL